ncbi:MAG: T9SS type A sorting domain-containing protein, partial [Calditrichia bacterium]
MMRKSNIISILTVSLLLFLIVSLHAREPRNAWGGTAFSKTSADKVTRTLFNVHNWAYWQYHDGRSGVDPDGNSGGIYPRGTAGVVFQDGIIWGGIVNNKIQVGGQTYSIGTQAGWITESGTPIDPNDARVRIYRIRSDWRTLTGAQIAQDAQEVNRLPSLNDVTEAMTTDIINQYADDWKNWPVDLGAPWVDKNNNGVYDPVLDENGAAIAADGDHPGIANADMVIWYVINDLDAGRVSNLYASDPIGLEMQVTMWGYNQPNAVLGQLIFKKYLIINKAGPVIDSTYLAQWCDPDLGNFSDDVVGNDSTLSLGFAYNGFETDNAFDEFNLAPAAMGYDFFQGPILQGIAGEDKNNNGVDDAEDWAIFNLDSVGPGFINLPMTSFSYYSAGNEEWTDPRLRSYDGTLEWYNALRGFITTTDVLNPTPFTHRETGKPTKFPLNGDPNLPHSATNDVDGQGANFSPADRRFALCSGPFVMQPGDSQEVVVALVGGSSGPPSPNGQIKSVNKVKENDAAAQLLFDGLFSGVPKPPAPPKILTEDITPLENEIVISWGNHPDAISATEDPVIAGYAFEGYNVYQLPTSSSSLDQAVRVATFDVVNGVETIFAKRFLPEFGTIVEIPVQFGKDSGIQRSITIDKNFLTGGALFPGNTYYFAVTAYNYNPNPELIEDKALETGATILPITTQSTMPGVRYSSDPLDQLEIDASGANSDGQVEVVVIDPKKTTGHDYELFFKEFEKYTPILDSTGHQIGTDTTVLLGWNVRDLTTGNLVVENQEQDADLKSNDQPIFDGLQAKVAGPPLTVKDWGWEDVGDVSPLYPGYDRGRWVSGVNWGGGALFGGLGMAHIFWGADPGVDPADFKTVEFRFTNMQSFTDEDGDGEYTLGWGPNGEGEPYFFDTSKGQKAFLYETWSTGSANFVGFHDIPFQVWDVEDPDNPRQVNVVVRDRDTNTRWDIWHDEVPYNYVWILADDYDPTGQAWDPNNGPENDFFAMLLSATGIVPAYYTLWAQQRGTRPFMARDGILTLIPNKINTVNDKFTFTAPAPPVEDSDLAKDDVDKITVYPNPYYAGNPQEPDRFTQFVTFYHLPAKATIRIFDVAGTQVRKLEKDDATTQFERWDLKNESGLPVASGMYIAHID